MIVRSDQWILLEPVAGSGTTVTARDGAAPVQACTQVAVGAGQDVLPQSSQWLQGAFAVLRSATGALAGTAAAATVVTLPAKTARQPRTAAKAGKRIISR